MIGVYGGTGFYKFLDNAQERAVDTPYGDPSDRFTVGTLDDVEVAFLPRHGRDHRYPPHRIPYRANAWAMRDLGVTSIIGPCAVGSLVGDYAPGHFVIPDQLVDRTWGRDHTFADGPEVRHMSFADPYSEPHRQAALAACREAGVTVHDGGTNVIIQGPRFSMRAESHWFAQSGFHLVNMTQIPEVPLAREQGLDYVNIAVVTDYDAGVEGHPAPVTHDMVLERFRASLCVLRDIVRRLIPRLAEFDQ
ncbi:MAG: S-methyl-5'-thioadenosine phosphorylase [Acidimicrobiia bacterium]|nr:S-methyl-5'-thioadenosine phosphorylase [Acidimicrobiia bacterium]